MPPFRPLTVLLIIIIAALLTLASSHNLRYTNRFFLGHKEPNSNDNDTAISDSTTSPNHHHHHKHGHKHGHGHVHKHRHGHKRVRHLPSHEFLKAHNKVRAGLGEPPLIWNKTLARYARRWAAKRAFDCQMIHSYGPYGENIFWGGKQHWSPADVVRSWVDEFRYYDSMSNICEPGQMCGHYTQVVWRETLRLGCARVRCISGGIFVVCNYDPPGNFVDESPFSGAGGSNVNPPASEISGEATPQQPPDEAQKASETLERGFRDGTAVQLSKEHNVSYEPVREELRSLHPDDPHIVVQKHKVWRVKGIIQISRSSGDAYLKRLEFNKEPLQKAAKKREMRYSDLKKIDRGVRRHFHDDITVVVVFFDHSLINGNSSPRTSTLSIRGGAGAPGAANY